MSATHPLVVTESTVAARLVEGLRDGGVPAAFGLDDPRGYFAALRRSDLDVCVVHDERAGGFMADGYSRAAGRPVACSGISGPGAVNLAPALLEARASDTPLVAVVGEFLPEEPGKRAFQEAEHASFLGAGLTKEVVEVRHASEAYAAARYAAERAVSGRRRPVLLLLSDALLWREAPEEDAAVAGRFAVPTYSCAKGAVEEACARLAAAERPLVLAGAGVHASGAYEELLELARRHALPVATSMSGKGAVPESDPVSLGVTGAYTSGREGRGAFALACLQEADLVLVVGSDLDALTTTDGAWPREGTRLIRLDIDAREVRSFPGLQLHGDARTVLGQMLAEAEVDLPPGRRGRLEELASRKARRDAEIADSDAAAGGEGTVWPGQVMAELGGTLGSEDWIVSDASYSSAWTLDRIVQTRTGRQVIAPRGVGTLGWGLAAAMGVKLAEPQSAVTAVSGDGALVFGLPEMETAARWGLDLNVVLLRNLVYGSQRQSNLLGQGVDYDDLHFGAAGLDHCELARAFGWSGLQVTDSREIAAVLAEARATTGPTLVDVAVDPEARPALAKFDPS